jgi:arylsulfatase A-like enzyme
MKKPNIIFIITDQQRADTINALGHGWAITPNLDSMVASGVSFTNAFCCGATCVSSRAALFTGMYPHNTGVYSFDHWAHQQTWLHDFRDAGYYLINMGKMHHDPVDAPMAFHERSIVENKTSNLSCDVWKKFLTQRGKRKPLDRDKYFPGWKNRLNQLCFDETGEYTEDEHPDMFVGNIAVERLKKWDPKSKKPLFMQIGFPGPHEPYDPPKRFYDAYKKRKMPDRIIDKKQLKNKPEEWEELRRYFAECKADAVIDFTNASEDEIADMRRHYYANITGIDEKIGELFSVLQEKKMTDNTIIVFTSDHGDNLGDYNMPYKWVMSDSVVNIPMIIQTPDTLNNPTQRNDLFSQIDIGPTLLELAGLPIPSRLDGKSQVDMLKEEKKGDCEEKFVFCEDNYLIMIRSSKYKMIYYIGQEYGEFYNLVDDPNEHYNLWSNDKYKKTKSNFREKILSWLSSSLYLNGSYKNKAEDFYYKTRFPQTNSKNNKLLQGSFI